MAATAEEASCVRPCNAGRRDSFQEGVERWRIRLDEYSTVAPRFCSGSTCPSTPTTLSSVVREVTSRSLFARGCCCSYWGPLHAHVPAVDTTAHTFPGTLFPAALLAVPYLTHRECAQCTRHMCGRKNTDRLPESMSRMPNIWKRFGCCIRRRQERATGD